MSIKLIIDLWFRDHKVRFKLTLEIRIGIWKLTVSITR